MGLTDQGAYVQMCSLEGIQPSPRGLSVVNAVCTRMRDLTNSEPTLYDARRSRTIAESFGGVESHHECVVRVENEHADSGRESQT